MQIFNQNCKLKTFDKSNSSDFKINPTGTITTFLLTSNRGLLNLPSHAINPIHNMKMWRPWGKISGGDFLRPARKLTFHSSLPILSPYWHANFPLIDINQHIPPFNGVPVGVDIKLAHFEDIMMARVCLWHLCADSAVECARLYWTVIF